MYQEADTALQLKAQQFCARWNKAIDEGKDLLEEEDTDSEEDNEEWEEWDCIAALWKCWE